MSWPRANVKFDEDVLNALDERISVSLTIFLFVFGISIPTTDLPSITSTTLTELTDNDLAISCAIPVILLALVPGAGWISNLVTTGPGNTVSTTASIPNSFSFVSRRRASSFNSSFDKDDPSSRALSRSWVLGIFVFLGSTSGLSIVVLTSLSLVSTSISFCLDGISFFCLLSMRIFLGFGALKASTFLIFLFSLNSISFSERKSFIEEIIFIKVSNKYLKSVSKEE